MHATIRLRRRLSTLAVAGAVAGAALVGTSTAASAAVPTAVSTAATSVTSASAILNGSVNPNGLSTTYYFQYGTTTGYGSVTTTFAAGAGLVAVAASGTATSLTANTTYYFQLVATNASGTTLGGQTTLFTSAATLVTTNRVYGNDRYQTSAQIAEAKYPGGVPSGAVVIATGADFPDALAGNYLAGQLGAPILLTPSSVLDPAFPTVTTALTALGATHVYILGGTLAVGADVEAALGAHYTVTRIAGATRYDTMQQIDTQLGYTPSTGITGGRTAIIATGLNFPDALAAGPLAWAKKLPLILTDGSQTTLSAQALAVISSLGITHFIVLGGYSSLNPSMIAQLSTLGTIDAQFAGADRTDTAAQLAAYEQSTYSFGKTSIILAAGTNFPDALSAGPWGGDTQSIYFALDLSDLGTYTTAALRALNGFTTLINIAGGFRALDDNASAAAVTAAQGGGSGTLAPTATTGAATNITGTTATLNATINPEGSSTSYVFQYGTTTSLGFTSTTQITSSSVGAQAVSVGVSGLSTGVLYYFRVVATNIYGTTYGLLQSFTANNATLTPTAATSAATSVTGATATLNGTVNPNGTSTTFYYEYGTDPVNYGGTTTVTNAGAGGVALLEPVGITGLAAATIYYAQLVANNAYGTVLGGQIAFKTALPIVTGLGTTGGTTLGGTTILINGSGFTGASGVSFGANPATNVVVNSDTQISATAPAGSAAAVHVTVTTPFGTSTTSGADLYTYVAPPTMTSAVVTPGMYTGGTSSGTTGTILVTFSAAVTCASAADYAYSNGSVTLNTCTPVGGVAPRMSFVLAPVNPTTLAAGGGGTLTYTQASPTTGNATFVAAGNSQVFEPTGDFVATS